MLSLSMGDRASIPCSVLKGDLPITIKWLKNRVSIETGQGISITQVDNYNSILVIEHLSAVHSANYTCVISNPAASMESSQMLLVNGKSHIWISIDLIHTHLRCNKGSTCDLNLNSIQSILL